MRGKERDCPLVSWYLGITPACAGKSVRRITNRCRGAGLPPRVRGKDLRGLLFSSHCGITPAYAGKSDPGKRRTSGSGDHPRACGEKLRIVEVGRVKEGSPPHMRGKGSGKLHCSAAMGITPACTGKSRRCRPAMLIRRDHPRVCGEKFHPASDRKLGRVQGTKRSSGPAPAAAPAGLAGSCPASPPWSYPPRITVSRPRP